MESERTRQSEWHPLTPAECAWLDGVRLQRENIALRQELLARDEERVRMSIAVRVFGGPASLEVDVGAARVRSRPVANQSGESQ